jgi:hypothetical protein
MVHIMTRCITTRTAAGHSAVPVPVVRPSGHNYGSHTRAAVVPDSVPGGSSSQVYTGSRLQLRAVCFDHYGLCAAGGVLPYTVLLFLLLQDLADTDAAWAQRSASECSPFCTAASHTGGRFSTAISVYIQTAVGFRSSNHKLCNTMRLAHWHVLV